MSSYFQEQLRVLLDGGVALARAFPRAADRLTGRSFDPDVERLLEGVAHITGQIAKKHDASFPEICQLLFDILFPAYLSPVPALAVAQLEGTPGRIPRGQLLESVPVLGTPCRFTTAYEVELPGLTLEEVGWQGRGRTTQLTLALVQQQGAESPASLERLRLHLHGETLLTRSLFQWLVTGIESLEILDADRKPVAQTDRPRLRPLGYREDEALFPWPFGSFPGFRLLQEYFCLPEKFLFVELEGLTELLRQLPPPYTGQPQRFSLRFNLKADSSRPLVVTAQNIQLGCTPVVNLFPHSADPIQRSHRRSDFLVRPAGPHLHYEVYRLLEVEGWSRQGVISYPILSELDLAQVGGAFCQVFRREVDRQALTYISVHEPAGWPLPHQTLICDLLCSNGQVPLGLHVGDTAQLDAPYSQHRCRLITPVTAPIATPVGAGLRRRLVSHLALAQQELTSLQALRSAMELYNFPALADPQQARAARLLLRGLLKAESQQSQHPYRRIPIWGQATTLTFDEAAFDTEAELYLLGCVLNEYVALQATINTFSQLTLQTSRRQNRYQWPKRLGSKTLTA